MWCTIPSGSQPWLQRSSSILERGRYWTVVGATLLAGNAQAIGKGSVQGVTGTVAITADQDVFVTFYLATIRLKDLSHCIASMYLV